MIQPSLWLELRYLGRSSIFEMAEGARPLMVGSGLCSDLRIDGPGVAVVHLEFTRRGGLLWLVPRPAAHVRLNAAHVGQQRVLPQHAMIEFLDHELEVWIHTRLPRPDALSSHARAEAPPATLRGLLRVSAGGSTSPAFTPVPAAPQTLPTTVTPQATSVPRTSSVTNSAGQSKAFTAGDPLVWAAAAPDRRKLSSLQR